VNQVLNIFQFTLADGLGPVVGQFRVTTENKRKQICHLHHAGMVRFCKKSAVNDLI